MIATAGTAVWPQVTGLATPLICRGEVVHQSQRWSVRPGEQGISRTIYCVTGDEVREDITLKAIGASFVVYSAMAFAVLGLAAALLIGRRGNQDFDGFGALRSPGEGDAGPGPAPVSPDIGSILAAVSDAVERGDARVVVRGMTIGDPAQTGPPAADPAERLAQLKQLFDRGLISTDDYEAKKAEILSDL
jgi:hypothetical protein